MPELTIESVVIFAAFVLPGTISMYIYGLKVPQADSDLKDKIVEAVSFSLLNFIVLFPMIQIVGGEGWISENVFVAWNIFLVCFVLAPVLWPFLLIGLLRQMGKQGLIMSRARTAWDEFFDKARSGCWIIVELENGKTIGGRFGEKSYASAYPDSGHLYIEELWEVLNGETFGDVLPGSPGVLLRPSDYKRIRVFLEN